MERRESHTSRHIGKTSQQKKKEEGGSAQQSLRLFVLDYDCGKQ